MAFNEAQVKTLDAKLNGNHVRTRTERGKELSYIEGWHAIAEANRVFGYDGWDREMVESTRVWQGSTGGAVQCSYTARVRIRVRAGEVFVIREGSGAGHGSALHAGEAHEQALKEAETDATKRALSSFGNIFGLALYDREKRGVRPAKRRSAPNPVTPRIHTGTLVLALSATDLEVFERPEAYCSAFRKVVELIQSADDLMSYWKANQDTVIGLRDQYPNLKTVKGVHYAQILGELYTRRLQEFAKNAKSPEVINRQLEKSHAVAVIPRKEIVQITRRLRDKEHLKSISTQPCLVCGRMPAHAHHLMFAQPRAMSKKVSDEYTVPLCALHHRELHDAGNEQGWWQRQKIDPVPAALEMWEESRKNDGRHREEMAIN
jgi:DNA recombination protein Rad52